MIIVAFLLKVVKKSSNWLLIAIEIDFQVICNEFRLLILAHETKQTHGCHKSYSCKTKIKIE